MESKNVLASVLIASVVGIAPLSSQAEVPSPSGADTTWIHGKFEGKLGGGARHEKFSIECDEVKKCTIVREGVAPNQPSMILNKTVFKKPAQTVDPKHANYAIRFARNQLKNGLALRPEEIPVLDPIRPFLKSDIEMQQCVLGDDTWYLLCKSTEKSGQEPMVMLFVTVLNGGGGEPINLRLEDQAPKCREAPVCRFMPVQLRRTK